MTAPKISILTPVWNGMPYLQECVESVLAQDFGQWEMLISDDASSDESSAYLATISDRRIRVFHQERNRGIFGNLDFLAGQASAPLSYILCQDDYFLPAGLSHVMACWEAQPMDVGAIRFNHSEIDAATSRFVRRQRQMVPQSIHPSNSAVYFFVFGNMPSNLSNNSLRTALIPEVGGFDQEFPYAGDFDFWSRLASRVSIHFEDTFVTHIRRHPNTASNLLNKRGELVPQLHRIVQRLGSQVAPKPDFRMRLHATATYDSRHRYIGVRHAIFGRTLEYLRTVDECASANPWFFGVFGRWLVFLLTAGGRFNQVVSAKMVLDKYAGTEGKS